MDDNTMDDNIYMDDNSTTDDDTDSSLSYSDPGIAKLKLKLSRIGMEYDVDYFQDTCLDVIFDYTIIYMKSFIRGMARHKRKYNIQCPVLTGKSDIVEDNNIVEDRPIHEKLWPWQVKINWEVVKEENITFIDDDLEDTEDLSLMFFKRPSVPVILVESKDTENKDTENKDTENKDTENKDTENKETENKETENKDTESKDTESKDTNASCLKSGSSKTDYENSSNVSKRTNPAKKRKLCETGETAVMKETNDSLLTKVENCDCKFNVKDFVDFLQSDPNAIPLRSISELFWRDAQEKIAKKIRIFDFYNHNKIKES